MSEKSVGARVKHKKDTSANWTKNNPVLLDGELVIVVTNSGEERFKIGDGTKKYSQLLFQDEIIKGSIPSISLKSWTESDV